MGFGDPAPSRVAPLESIAGYQPLAVLSTSTPSRTGASNTAPRENPPPAVRQAAADRRWRRPNHRLDPDPDRSGPARLLDLLPGHSATACGLVASLLNPPTFARAVAGCRRVRWALHVVNTSGCHRSCSILSYARNADRALDSRISRGRPRLEVVGEVLTDLPMLSSRIFMHPYQNAPDRSFWSRSVSSGFDVRQLADHDGPLIRPGEPVASAGSCFASNLVPFLEAAGFEYLRTETRNPALSNVRQENLGYENFSAAYGNIYTPRQLLQLLRRSLGSFRPAEDRWHTDAGVIDPFRPGLRYHALTDREFDLLGAQHLRAVRRVFEEAKVFIFTLGLTEG